MVTMPEFTCGKRLPFHVVFAIGRRDDDVLRFGALEQNTLEGSQAWRIQVFNHLHHGGGIEIGQPLVAVDERAVQQAQAFLLGGRETVVMQTVSRDFECAMRYVHANDFCKLLFLQQRLQQPPFAAPQIQNASRAGALHHGQH